MKKIITNCALLLVTITNIAICSEQLQSSFFSITGAQKTAYGFHIPHPLPNNDGSIFYDACFHLPSLLQKAQQDEVPFILAIPDDHEKVATMSCEAPFIEGARVALAWVSAYHRFEKLGSVDVRILLIPKEYTTNQVIQSMENVLSKSIDSSPSSTPEQSIKRRIFRANDSIIRTPEITLSAISLPSVQEVHTHITPQNHSEKTVVLTGAAGFLGAHFAHELLNKGYYVIGLDNFVCSTGDNLTALKENTNFEFHELDITRSFDVEGTIDLVAHFASVPSPADYYVMPIETLRAGLHGTKQTLDLAVRKNARYLLTSTSEVYGDPEVNPQTEDYSGRVDPIGKRSQYDQSKRGGETLSKLYFDKYNIDIRIARIFNTFGPGMRLDDGRVITNFIKAGLSYSSMIIHGTGNQTRSLAYVSDTVNGLVRLAESEQITPLKHLEERVFNIGNPQEWTINNIAQAMNRVIKQHLGYTVPIRHIPHFDLTDPKVRKPDITRAHNVINYTPHIAFEDGLEKTFLHFHKKD